MKRSLSPSPSCSHQSKIQNISRLKFVEFGTCYANFFRNLKHATKYESDFSFLQINNIPTIAKCFDLIQKKRFKTKIYGYEKIIGINLRINEVIDEKFNENPHLYDLWTDKNIFIAFQSTLGGHESKTYWKDSNCERIYSIFIDDDETEDTAAFFHEILVDEIKNKRNDLIKKNINRKSIHIHEIGDDKGQNLLHLAINQTRASVVKNLLKHEFDPDDVIDVAWTTFVESKSDKSAEIVLYLLNANARIPANFDYNEASKEVQEFVDFCEDLHDDIDQYNYIELKTKLNLKSHLMYFYNRYNQSLLAHAIKTEKFHLFKDFENGFNTGSHEDLGHIYSKLERDEKHELGFKRQDTAVIYPESHLFVLKSKTKIGNNDRFLHKHWKYIDEAYRTVNNNSYCSKILKLAAKNKKLKIFFDFKHDTIYYMDPPNFDSSGKTYGIFNSDSYTKKCTVIIGAKFLTDEVKKIEVFKVLAHEFCHLAVHMSFYQPNSEPYPLGESQVKTKYDKVMRHCKQNKDHSEVIENVFRSYEDIDQEAEIIVTVPEMLIKYQNDPETLDNFKSIFNKLFEFSTQIVEPEIDRTLNVLEDERKPIKYEDLTASMQAKFLNSTILFQGVETSLQQLVQDDHDIGRQLTADDIRKVLLDDKVLRFGDICELNSKDSIIERKFVSRCSDDEPRSRFYRKDSEEEFIKKEIRSLNDICKEVRETKVFILADHAGTGKTTTFKYLTPKQKKMKKNFWVSYVNLRKCSRFFEEFKENGKELSPENIVQFLLEMMNENSMNASEIFTKLYSRNQVSLIFDGLDEICPKFTQLMFNIFKIIKKSESKIELWISTRPHYANKLEKLFNTSAYKFVGFSNGELINCIYNVINASKLSDKKKEELSDAIPIQFILHSLNNYSCISNPLMIKIITEIQINDKLFTYISSSFKLYTEMIERQKKLVGDKIPIEDHDRDSMITVWDIHRIFALICIVGDNYEDLIGFKLDDLEIMKKWKKEKKNWTCDMIQRYGFVVVDLGNPENEKTSISFIHRTYAEFFVAQFLINYVCSDNDDVKDEELRLILNLFNIVLERHPNFYEVCKFIESFFENEGCKFEICKRLKKLMFEKFSEIQSKINNPNGVEKFKLLVERYSKIGRIDDEVAKKLWKLDEVENLFEKSLLVDPIFDYCLIRSANECFGPNWHEKFNKSDSNLITATEIENKLEIQPECENFLKCCDYVDKNFDETKRINFYEKVSKNKVKFSASVESEKISRARNAFGKEKFAEIFIINTDFNTLCSDSLNLIHKIFHKDFRRKESRNILLNPQNVTKSLPLVIAAQLSSFFGIVLNFYEKYIDIWKELQDAILASSTYDILCPAQKSTFEEYFKLIQNVFQCDTSKIASKIEKFFLSVKKI